ncbi:hypothetical protein [Geobacillus subterraneus]|uniref:Uncharacterized protein n=1 Tax=Geobacillus subterraneus TaxID=129338 RepID=A0A679FZ32_9BACL|nr:hypothetical protein [Geobacillus subterraneus]BBW98966.1 hypothetical protein GsuE55_37990 [Geobacillus subterraneus]
MKKHGKEYVWFDGKWRRKEERVVRANQAEPLKEEKAKMLQASETRAPSSWKRLTSLDKRWMVVGGGIVLLLGLVQCASTWKEQRSFVRETVGSLYLSSQEQKTVMDAYKRLREQERALSVIKEVSDWQQQWMQDAKEEVRLIQSWMETRENIKEALLLLQEQQARRMQQVEERKSQETGDAKTLYRLLLERMKNTYSFSLFAQSSMTDQEGDLVLLQQKMKACKQEDDRMKRELVERMKRYASHYGIQVQEQEGELVFFLPQPKDKTF